MSTRALREIQADGVRVARKISFHDVEPQDIDPISLRRLAEQLVEIAARLSHHRASTPDRMAAIAKLAMGNHREPEPR